MKFNRVLAFLLVFVLIPLSLLPTAAAATYTEILQFETANSDSAQHDPGPMIGGAVAMADTNVLLGLSEGISTTSRLFNVKHCDVTECVDGSSNLRTAGNIFGANFHRLPETNTAYGCSVYVDVNFHKSLNGGNSWTDTPVATTGQFLAHCDVASFDGSHYAIVWSNTTTDDWIFSISASGGSSGTWVSYLLEANTDLNSADSVLLYAYSDTEYVALVGDGNGFLNKCRTADSGVTWVCTADLVSAAETVRGEIGSDGIAYFAVADLSTANMKLGVMATSTDDPVFFTVPPGAVTSVQSIDLAVFDETRFAVSFGSAATTLGYVSETIDGGLSWVTELAFTSDAAPVGNQDTGIAYTTGGDIVGYYYYKSADESLPSGPDADAQAERIWTAFTTSEGASVIGASATAAVTGLVGFDVDPTGTTVVARTESGSKVAIFDGLGLTLTSSPEIETNCDLGFYEDAVMARYGGTLVGFLNCDATGEAQFFSIRESDGSAPELDDFTDCASFDDCPFNIDLTTFPSDQTKEALGQMGQIQDFPIDYSHKATAPIGGGVTASHVAWAFATQECDEGVSELAYCDGSEPGDVGVALLNARVTLSDSEQDEIEAFSTSIVNDFCVGLDNGEYYLAAGDTGIPGRVWTVTFPLLTGSINQFGVDITPGNTFLSDVTSLACGGGQILAVSDTAPDAAYLLTRTGSVLDSITGITATDRGATISEEFVLAPGEDSETCFTASTGTGNCVQYGAVYDAAGPTVLIYNLTGGSIVEVGSIPAAELPGGSFFAIRMDRSAQNIWVATTTTIARYFVVNETTLVPVGNPSTPGGGGVVPSEGTGLFGGSGATIGTAFGVGAFGGNLFLGALLMGIVAYGVGTGYGNIDSTATGSRALRVNPWAAAIGAAIGFLVAWGFGFFTTAAVFSIIALVSMIVGIKLWTSRGG